MHVNTFKSRLPSYHTIHLLCMTSLCFPPIYWVWLPLHQGQTIKFSKIYCHWICLSSLAHCKANVYRKLSPIKINKDFVCSDVLNIILPRFHSRHHFRFNIMLLGDLLLTYYKSCFIVAASIEASLVTGTNV